MRVICSFHPRYLGKRKPTSNCICCNTMWQMINRPAEGAHPGGYTTLFGYDDHSSMRIVPEPKRSKTEEVNVRKITYSSKGTFLPSSYEPD